MVFSVQEATVTVQYVSESKTRAVLNQPEGRQRWVIGAEKTTGDSKGERMLGLTTLNPWMASLCIQARDQKFTVAIKYRETKYFDADLLWVGRIEPEAHAAQ
jgi:hypothetical protein